MSGVFGVALKLLMVPVTLAAIWPVGRTISWGSPKVPLNGLDRGGEDRVGDIAADQGGHAAPDLRAGGHRRGLRHELRQGGCGAWCNELLSGPRCCMIVVKFWETPVRRGAVDHVSAEADLTDCAT